jgi:hypothetical protein
MPSWGVAKNQRCLVLVGRRMACHPGELEPYPNTSAADSLPSAQDGPPRSPQWSDPTAWCHGYWRARLPLPTDHLRRRSTASVSCPSWLDQWGWGRFDHLPCALCSSPCPPLAIPNPPTPVPHIPQPASPRSSRTGQAVASVETCDEWSNHPHTHAECGFTGSRYETGI